MGRNHAFFLSCCPKVVPHSTEYNIFHLKGEKNPVHVLCGCSDELERVKPWILHFGGADEGGVIAKLFSSFPAFSAFLEVVFCKVGRKQKYIWFTLCDGCSLAVEKRWHFKKGKEGEKK